MKSPTEYRSSIGFPAILAIALFLPLLLTDSTIATLTATPLREAVSAILATLILLGVCYLAVPHMSVDGSDATERGEN